MGISEEIWRGPLPTIHDVYMARRVIAPHLPRTPLVHAPALDRLLGARVYADRRRVETATALLRQGVGSKPKLRAGGSPRPSAASTRNERAAGRRRR